MSLSIVVKDESETHQFAKKIASLCKTGDVILLKGGLGVGKSSFARAFVNAFSPAEEIEVLSPTFTLLQTYDVADVQIWHCDFYRLERIEDAIEIGIEDGLNHAITLIEWPEIMTRLLPEDVLEINMSYGGGQTSRIIAIEKHGRFKSLDV